jgi:hypothetical protein
MTIVGAGSGHRDELGFRSTTPSEPAPELSEQGVEAFGAKGPAKVGIAFVHGIGNQKPGETLLALAPPLVDLIMRWSATTPGVEAPNDPVLESQIDFNPGKPAYIRARLPAQGEHPEQEWWMTEAWWAARVSPPSVGEMFAWLFPWQMIRIVWGILHGLANHSVVYRIVEWFFLTIFVVPITIAVFLVYVLFRLLRLIPIKAIQDFVVFRGIEFFLSDWFGDVRLLLADRSQAANIRSAVAATVQWLTSNGCTSVVLVCHSGGTIAGYMTLTDDTYAEIEVDRFITHGQALGLAWRLGDARKPSRVDRAIDRLYAGDRLRIPLHQKRPKLEWFDFWATHDPAPAGGFDIRGAVSVSRPSDAHGTSEMVYNRMSLRNDHGAYWANDESFVLPVARLIETSPTNASPSTSRFFPAEPRSGDTRADHRTRRVTFLQYAWVGVMLSALVTIELAVLDLLAQTGRTRLDDLGRAVYDILSWVAFPIVAIWNFLQLPAFPTSATLREGVAILIGLAAWLVVAWLVSSVMGTLWNAWDRRERVIALQPKPEWRPVTHLVIQLALCSLASLSLVYFALNATWTSLIPAAILLIAAYVSKALSPPGVVRRVGADEVDDREEIVKGKPGIADV